MTALSCPHCASPLAEDGRCAACGLDGSLLLAIRAMARELAAEAARRAGDGSWSEAYELAAESLRLMGRDNDLAAFVVLASVIAGARGPVQTVPRPRPDRLPEALAPHIDAVLATAEKLRRGEGIEEGSDAHPRWTSRCAAAGAAAVLFATGALLGGWWWARVGARRRFRDRLKRGKKVNG